MITFEPSLLALVLLVGFIALAVAGWRHCTRIQRQILDQTTRILAICESVETFYGHAVEAQRAIELAVAAGIAKETLEENFRTLSMN